MFNLKEFVVKNIVNGIKNGTFSKEYGNIMAVNYLLKGILTEDDVASIDAQITAWEAEKAEQENTSANEDIPAEEVEEPTEEPVADDTDEEEPAETETETVPEENEPENEEIDPEAVETETVE